MQGPIPCAGSPNRRLYKQYTVKRFPCQVKGKEVFKRTSLWNEVKASPDYADIADDDNLVLSKCHARIAGKVAAQVLEKIAKENWEIARDKVINWVKETWNYICNDLGLGNFSITENDKEILDGQKVYLNVKDFLSMPMKDLMNGKEFSVNHTVVTDKTVSKKVSPIIVEDFAALYKSLRFNANFEIQSEKLGEEVSIFPGSTGKHGLGIRHIIEERVKKDNLSENEITALSALILETVRTGEITRDSSNLCEITKNGIIAIVRKDLDDEKHNWVLTGFAYKGEDLIKKKRSNRNYTNGYRPI